MANERQSAAPPAPPIDGTLPQWQPPASATRELQIAPKPASGAPAEPAAPSISGTRPGAEQEPKLIGLEHTLQAEPVSVEPPELLRVGDIIVDRYVIEEHISSGGFGAVYRASDRQIRHHQVAIKLLHRPAKDEQAQKAALRELALIASVSHPSVVQFKDYGWYQGRLWFAMPWYRGETLAQRFSDSEGPLPLSRKVARPIFERLARGLAAMHEVGIYHHDIKPENIFVADVAGFDGGLPVLLDLGIASTRGEGPKGLTVEYAAPEVAAAALGNREKPIGGAADAFSLALVLRNVLEPESAPTTQGELLSLLHRRATEPVSPPTRRDLRYLKPAFERWLSLDPAERPTAAELAEELAVLTAPEERREQKKRLLRRIVPIVLVAAAAVTLLVLQVRKQKTELTVQQKQLSQQLEQSEQLRKLTAEQLAQLEEKSEQIGEQGQQLQRAIAIARRLDDRLERAEQRETALTRKVRKLTDEKSELTRERDGLASERDALVRARDALTRERDQLVAERDGLKRERDRLEEERNTVLAQRNEAIQKHTKLQVELADAERRVLQASTESEAMRRSLDAARDELKALRDKSNELEAQRKRLEAENRSLEARLSALSRAADPPVTSNPIPEGTLDRIRLRPR